MNSIICMLVGSQFAGTLHGSLPCHHQFQQPPGLSAEHQAAAAPQVLVSSVPQSAVDALAELRSEAVHEILNRQATTDSEFTALASYTQDWWGTSKADFLEKNFSKAEQLNFTRLGAVPNVLFSHAYNAAHAKILREYASGTKTARYHRSAHSLVTPRPGGLSGSPKNVRDPHGRPFAPASRLDPASGQRPCHATKRFEYRRTRRTLIGFSPACAPSPGG
jgi:hypothetical protein